MSFTLFKTLFAAAILFLIAFGLRAQDSQANKSSKLDRGTRPKYLHVRLMVCHYRRAETEAASKKVGLWQ
jgi:hypothetical protein